MSGLGAPARTAIATPERAIVRQLSAMIAPRVDKLTERGIDEDGEIGVLAGIDPPQKSVCRGIFRGEGEAAGGAGRCEFAKHAAHPKRAEDRQRFGVLVTVRRHRTILTPYSALLFRRGTGVVQDLGPCLGFDHRERGEVPAEPCRRDRAPALSDGDCPSFSASYLWQRDRGHGQRDPRHDGVMFHVAAATGVNAMIFLGQG